MTSDPVFNSHLGSADSHTQRTARFTCLGALGTAAPAAGLVGRLPLAATALLAQRGSAGEEGGRSISMRGRLA